MKVNIQEDENINDTEVLITCKTKDAEIDRLVKRIRGDKERLICYEDKTIHYIQFKEIFYIESVDNTVFVYLEDKVLETKLKLYELEEKLKDSYFTRCRKASILINFIGCFVVYLSIASLIGINDMTKWSVSTWTLFTILYIIAYLIIWWLFIEKHKHDVEQLNMKLNKLKQ